MGESQWVPFDAKVSALLESLWVELQKQREREQQDQHPEAVVEINERTRRQEQEGQQRVHISPTDVAQQQQRQETGQRQQRQQQEQQQQQLLPPPAEHPAGELIQLRDTGGLGTALPHPISHKVYVYLPPWQYCIDLDKMLQQNISTHRVRPIRRTNETGALWFVRGQDGFAQRFDPTVELHLEELRQQSLCGPLLPDGRVAVWQETGSGSLHFTDVLEMNDTTDGDSTTAREVARMEINGVAPAATTAATEGSDSASAIVLPHLPSLSVGNQERGEAFCRGHREALGPEDFEAALLPVDANAIPEDSCAICLDALLAPVVSPRLTDIAHQLQEHQQQQQLSDSSANGETDLSAAESLLSRGGDGKVEKPAVTAATSSSNNNDEVVRLKECMHHFHVECIRLYMRSNSRGGFFCPTCNVLQLPGNGPSPPGKAGTAAVC